jgi:putative nucleotidyltransferase with HDIG domain
LGDILPKERALLDEGFVSHIRVPLIVKGEPIGVLCVGSRRSAAFTPEHLSTLEKLATQIGVAMENTRLITDLKELLIGTVKSLSNAIDAKSPWTAGHSERVTRYALLMGKAMELSVRELKDLELAGLLHDVGKIATSDAVLNKPGTLTRDEYEEVKKHSHRGAELLQPIKQLKNVIPVIRHHHERYDGNGYPDGLSTENIPLWARVLSVADAYDSMTVDRPYRKRFDQETALEELVRCSGSQFDPEVVLTFIGLMRKQGEQTQGGVAQCLQPHPAVNSLKTIGKDCARLDA